MDFFRWSYGLAKWYTIDVGKKSSSSEIFELLCRENTIRYIDDFSIDTHHFCVVEIDLFDDSFDSLYPYRFPDFECLTHDDRETSKEIREDILACEGEDRSSDTGSCQKSSGTDMERFEDEKSSPDPYKK